MRADVFLVVGWVVLPDLEVASCLGWDYQTKFREEMLFVAQFVGYIAEGWLKAVNDQS